jgi:tetratricopeptide (TPR) repeat protein
MMPIDWPAPRTLIAAGLGALVLLLVLGGAWFWYSAQQDRAQTVHAEALARAAAARGGQNATATGAAIQTLETALAQAPGAALAGQSAYELGHLRFDAGQYPGARAAYEIALAKTSSATIRTLARAGIAATWEAQQDFAKAVDAYSAALAGESASQFYYEDLLIGLARTQELAGRRNDAIGTYKRLLKEVPKLRREPEVRGRLASLGASS